MNRIAYPNQLRNLANGYGINNICTLQLNYKVYSFIPIGVVAIAINSKSLVIKNQNRLKKFKRMQLLMRIRSLIPHRPLPLP